MVLAAMILAILGHMEFDEGVRSSAEKPLVTISLIVPSDSRRGYTPEAADVAIEHLNSAMERLDTRNNYEFVIAANSFYALNKSKNSIVVDMGALNALSNSAAALDEEEAARNIFNETLRIIKGIENNSVAEH